MHPDVTVRARKREDKFILLACDGIWDCLTNEKCVETIQDIMKQIKPKKDQMHLPVERLFDQILAPNTDDGIGTDNMTAILIVFLQD